MARLARLVIPGVPHHVTQRGNRRQRTFFCEEDYSAYLKLMAQWCAERGVAIWAYCLMPNHVHLIAVPQSEDALSRAIGEAHRRYTRRINFREKWRGYLVSVAKRVFWVLLVGANGSDLGGGGVMERLDAVLWAGCGV